VNPELVVTAMNPVDCEEVKVTAPTEPLAAAENSDFCGKVV
jgi:hypothetical protein